MKHKAAIIGCGGIANQKHLPALANASDRVEIVGFCDLIEERAIKAAEQYLSLIHICQSVHSGRTSRNNG